MTPPETSAALYTNFTIPSLSLLELAVVLLLVLPPAAVFGNRMGARRRAALLAAGRDLETAAGETTLGAILALLGLLLAFSFGNALTLSNDRKSSIVDEAAALGTAFLRADYLEEPGRTQLQTALLAYAETRVVQGDGAIDSLEAAQSFIERTLTAQAALWPVTLEVTQDPVPPPIKTFVAGAVNDAIDAHLVRVKTLANPVSEITQAMILAAALISLFLLGNRSGLVGRPLSWRTFVFSAFLYVVMLTILDTQRGGEGLVRTDDTAILATIFDMQVALKGRTGG